VIIRVYRARVKPGVHEAYERLLREEAVPRMLASPGLVSLHVGTPLEDPPQEFLLMSIWRDLAALRAFVGTRWRESLVLAGEAHLVAEAIVDHYEVAEELVAATSAATGERAGSAG
jgi:heme-degrading monooxygenase HmoA